MNSNKYTVKQITEFIRKELKAYYPINEIQQYIFLIFEHQLGFSRVDVVLKSTEIPDDKSFLLITDYIRQLKQHKPIQYIFGETTFYGLPLSVTPAVLIPRPETEELVRWIIRENNFENPRILDIGTGSGCIAISLAKNIPGAYVEAIDNSEDVIELANKNAVRNAVNIVFVRDNILKPSIISEKTGFNLIVSNPPYVTHSEKIKMHKNVINYEPSHALFVLDEDPLIFYKAILDFTDRALKENGLIFFEINETFHKEIVVLMKNHKFADIELQKDINDKFRMIKGRKAAIAIKNLDE